MSARNTLGKCVACKLVHAWAGRPLLRDAYCSRCRKPLARTTHELLSNRRWTLAGRPVAFRATWPAPKVKAS